MNGSCKCDGRENRDDKIVGHNGGAADDRIACSFEVANRVVGSRLRWLIRWLVAISQLIIFPPVYQFQVVD